MGTRKISAGSKMITMAARLRPRLQYPWGPAVMPQPSFTPFQLYRLDQRDCLLVAIYKLYFVVVE